MAMRSSDFPELLDTPLRKIFFLSLENSRPEYQRWIKHESKGILKLNKITRNMFYRHAPLRKELRDTVKNLPAFGEIATRFANIRNRKRQELETKYKKYMRDGGKLPKLLQENLDFYGV